MRFKITWSNCEYRVSIPRYKGGDVVTADEHDALLARHNALVEAVKKEHLAFGALDDAGFQLGAVGMPIWTDHAAARAEVDRLLQEPPC